ncbi:hypothetical protein ACOKM5_35885 [Streptomyces sp. BH097]|uniref:hypothetical protein n=1 Tax=unclassified Streptomyces TaxID=2593676 RepID=UPI003BB68E1C
MLEHLPPTARRVHSATTEAEDWGVAKMARILSGSPERATDEIRAKVDDRHLAGEGRIVIDPKSLHVGHSADSVLHDRQEPGRGGRSRRCAV